MVFCTGNGNALIISRIFHYFKIEVHVAGGDLDCKTSSHIRNAFLGNDQLISLSVLMDFCHLLSKDSSVLIKGDIL